MLSSEEGDGYTAFRATFKTAEGVGQDSDVKAILIRRDRQRASCSRIRSGRPSDEETTAER